MNIAIFGGSFDPPHIGHEEIIKESLKQLDIEVLFIVPTFLNPFKDSFLTPPKIRYSWINKLASNYPKTEVLDFEIKQNSPTPTIKTIQHIIKLHNPDKIYLIIGADNIKNLDKWREYDKLKKLVKFVVATRGDIKIPKNLQKLNICANISSTKLRKNIEKKYLPKSIADEVIKYYNREQMEKRIENIINILDEKKAENIQLFDMRDTDYFVDKVIIATTLGEKHGHALLDYLKKGLKADESYFEIDPSDEWSVVDLGDILIHLMSSEYRAKYNLEEFLSQREKESKEEI